MMNSQWIRSLSILGGLSVTLFGLCGCVDQEPSLSLRGSVVYEGEVAGTSLRCDFFSEEPGSVENYFTHANIDIQETLEFGQPGGSSGEFLFSAEMENHLSQSDQVGAGAGDDEFEGLRVDQNTIMVTRADINFPEDLNDFDGADILQDLEKEELFTAVVESNGGAAIVKFPLFTASELGDLAAIHESLVGDSPQSAIRITAEIQLHGETYSGKEVESNRFEYPISVCRSCAPDKPEFDEDEGIPEDFDLLRYFATTPLCAET